MCFRTLLGPSAVFFTILLNPGDAFDSMYNYYNMRQAHGGKGIKDYVWE